MKKGFRKLRYLLKYVAETGSVRDLREETRRKVVGEVIGNELDGVRCQAKTNLFTSLPRQTCSMTLPPESLCWG